MIRERNESQAVFLHVALNCNQCLGQADHWFFASACPALKALFSVLDLVDHPLILNVKSYFFSPLACPFS